MDFITDLPPSMYIGRIYNSILVVMDRYSKIAYYVPCRKTIDAPELVQLFIREVVRLYGVPKTVVSDRGPILTSKY
jgi:hypothetical protein